MKKTALLLITHFVFVISIVTACSGRDSASLVGDWKLVSYESSTNPRPADPNVETSLIFGSDGKLNGNMGCNSFNGDYEVDGNTVTLGSITSTMMACADPIMQQESTVFIVFSNPATFKIDGNTLTITSADGESVVVVKRK